MIDIILNLWDYTVIMINQTLLYQHIGSVIRKRREMLGMTQAQLATSVGLLRTSIVNLEAGNQRIPLHTLYPLCAVLGIDVIDALPTIRDILEKDQLVLPIDGIDTVVPARTAAFVSGLLGEQQERDIS